MSSLRTGLCVGRSFASYKWSVQPLPSAERSELRKVTLCKFAASAAITMQLAASAAITMQLQEPTVKRRISSTFYECSIKNVEHIISIPHGINVEPIISISHGINVEPIISISHGINVEPIISISNGINVEPIISISHGINSNRLALHGFSHKM